MKSTGMVRRIDDLGRVVIPKEFRTTMGIQQSDPLEIFVEGDRIILRKYVPGCKLCESEVDVQEVDGVHICMSCVKKLAKNYF